MKSVGATHIENRIRAFKREERIPIIPYITAFDPDKEATLEHLKYLAEANPAVIELGFPFSDPVADGPTIQKAMVRAIAQNPTVEEYLEIVSQFKSLYPHIPLVCMTYYNIVFRRGLKTMVEEAVRAGLDGFIIPDLPLEEASSWLKANRGYNLATIFLGAPTSSLERIRKIASASTGFFYYVSLTGITGARTKLPEDLVERLKAIRSLIKRPLAVGFGISRPEHVAMLKPHCDAIVVGSALVQIIEKEGKKAGPKLRDFLNKLTYEGSQS